MELHGLLKHRAGREKTWMDARATTNPARFGTTRFFYGRLPQEQGESPLLSPVSRQGASHGAWGKGASAFPAEGGETLKSHHNFTQNSLVQGVHDSIPRSNSFCAFVVLIGFFMQRGHVCFVQGCAYTEVGYMFMCCCLG